MNLEFTILIIILVYLRKTLQSKVLLPKTDRYLFVGIWVTIILLIANILFHQINAIFVWIAHLMLFSLIYFCLTLKDFKSVKFFIYSVLPFAVVNLISDLTKLINLQFQTKWDNYFDTAILFSIIWFFAMYFINKKQRKDIRTEQLKAIEREKEFQQSEILKAKLELQVSERTAELVGQKNELQKALDELKITQTQLIQSEKMASLGELTAGIAHEIQNPLNFVNNFSEINKELVDELQVELKSGNVEEAINISNDIKENEQKINHHGKRADAIVKGMLQHSRSSNGVKEPTDLNALCDEYTRLSYHGLRAKDKTFNAKIISDYDESISKINVVPQDFGRVILNLLTNAFYAVNEKLRAHSENKKVDQNRLNDPENYQPTVSISTKKEGDKVIITVSDNGNGMLEEIKEKIFLPFFTTKPSGKGTGLGLSLSYDIITKGHNGELTVESVPNEGTTFTIILKL